MRSAALGGVLTCPDPCPGFYQRVAVRVTMTTSVELRLISGLTKICRATDDDTHAVVPNGSTCATEEKEQAVVTYASSGSEL